MDGTGENEHMVELATVHGVEMKSVRMYFYCQLITNFLVRVGIATSSMNYIGQFPR